jgi:predicted  nucleic acid-binding Zn-ribbon protein
MSIQLPSLEARVGAQEHMTTMLHARVQELSKDMTTAFQRVEDGQLQNNRKIDALSQDLTVASFEQLVSYQKQTERKIDERFGKIEEDIAEIKATKEDLAAVEGDMQVMERRMDQRMLALGDRIERRIDAFEERMLESFKQVLAMMNTRLPPAQ